MVYQHNITYYLQLPTMSSNKTLLFFHPLNQLRLNKNKLIVFVLSWDPLVDSSTLLLSCFRSGLVQTEEAEVSHY